MNEPNLVILNSSEEVVATNDPFSEAVTLEVTVDQHLVENLNFRNLEEIKKSRNPSFNGNEINSNLDQNITQDNINPEAEGMQITFFISNFEFQGDTKV